jgi:hypothetical protein
MCQSRHAALRLVTEDDCVLSAQEALERILDLSTLEK